MAALVVAIGIPVCSSHTLLAHRSHELSDAEEQVTNAALTLKYHAARTIEVADGRVLAVARYVRDHPGDLTPQLLHDVIREQIDSSRGIGNIVVTDRDGVMIADGTFPTRQLDVRERDYFQSLRDDPHDRLAIGRPVIGKLSGKPVLPVARRLVGPDGAFAGIVQTSLDVGAFQEVYDAVANGDGGVLTLWRTDGTLLVRSPQAPNLVGRTTPTDAMYGEWLVPGSSKPRWMTSPVDGDEQVVALGFLDGHPIYVGSALRKEEVLAPWYRLGGMQGAIGASLTILVVTALLLLSHETERRQATDARIRLLAENATDVFIIGDSPMKPLYVSPGIRATLGYTPEELLDSDATAMIHPDDRAITASHWAKFLDGDETGRSYTRHLHKAGHYVWLEASLSSVPDPGGGRRSGYVAVLRDVTERREAEERICHIAMHDALTGLPNRTLFHERLHLAITEAARTGGQLAVLACDLDRFKAVNDSLGHPAGDALLLVAAERMKAVLQPLDTVARLGGDEFAVVLAQLDANRSITDVASRLIAAVGEPVELDGRTIEVGLSIGYTIATGDDANADELFKRADMALYEAKSGGRNTYRAYRAEDGARIATRGRLGLDMKESIRRGEFRLVYQPVVHAVTGAVLGMEALMRWRHPVRGEVSPGEFIPLAEETGLIVALGEWALREACREATAWPPGLHVAVNVSPIQFRRPGLEQAVLIALGTSGLSPGRLVIEITESLLMDDSETAIAGLHRLRSMGVQVALDDFGTGYSSLSYLRRFPFDKIKIDRSFIRDIADPDAAAIVRAVAGIGERLGMSVVAEGVETAEQLALVQQEGCTYVQGFLFSRPLAPADARAYVAASREEAA